MFKQPEKSQHLTPNNISGTNHFPFPITNLSFASGVLSYMEI